VVEETIYPQPVKTDSTTPSTDAIVTYGPYYRMANWTDNQAKPVVVRTGTYSGFGWEHLRRHNVSIAMLQKTTKFPKTREPQGSAIVYRTPANEYICSWGVCRISRSMMVRVVVENTRMSDGYQKGVITAYCEGPHICPDWVRRVA
jgi:hypothetical protein